MARRFGSTMMSKADSMA